MENMHNRLKQCRKAKNLSQYEVADRIKIKTPTWNKYENGKSGMTVETLYKICTTLDVSADWLLGLFEHDDISAVTQFYDRIMDLMDEYNTEGLIPDNKIDEVINDINDIYACFQEP